MTFLSELSSRLFNLLDTTLPSLLSKDKCPVTRLSCLKTFNDMTATSEFGTSARQHILESALIQVTQDPISIGPGAVEKDYAIEMLGNASYAFSSASPAIGPRSFEGDLIALGAEIAELLAHTVDRNSLKARLWAWIRALLLALDENSVSYDRLRSGSRADK